MTRIVLHLISEIELIMAALHGKPQYVCCFIEKFVTTAVPVLNFDYVYVMLLMTRMLIMANAVF